MRRSRPAVRRPCPQSRASRGSKCSLVDGAWSRLPSFCRRSGSPQRCAPRRSRPQATALASCFVPRPTSARSLPPPPLRDLLNSDVPHEHPRGLRPQRATSCPRESCGLVCGDVSPSLPLSPCSPPLRPRAQVCPAQRFCGDVPRGRPRCVVLSAECGLAFTPTVPTASSAATSATTAPRTASSAGDCSPPPLLLA